MATKQGQAFDPSIYKEGMLDEVALDGFEVKKPSGAVVHPHAGESVWLLPYGMSLADELKIGEFVEMSRGEQPDQEKVDAAFDSVCLMLNRIIVGWTITNQFGKPYAQPSEGPEAIKAIPSRLFKHILDLIRGEEPEGEGGGGSAA